MKEISELREVDLFVANQTQVKHTQTKSSC